MKIVIALGGNALGETPEKQWESAKYTANIVVDLVEEGHDLIITHGNGPQVGIITKAFEESNRYDKSIPIFPLAECNAMSQGYIGFHLQNHMEEELKRRNINKSVSTIITQVLVDKNDNAFNNPSKPIGSFYSEKEAKEIEKNSGYTFMEDAGRGYRRVVPSPMPKEIIEFETVKTLANNNHIVIAGGGGGIPVYKDDFLKGIDAVIDKDFVASLIAREINADLLIILTAVDKVALNFNKENQVFIDEMNINDAKKYIEENHFAKGSMLPKIEASIKFVEATGNNALICSLDKAKEGIEGKTGTLIKK